MPFNDLSLTRDDIDAFEGETFRGVNVSASTTWSASDQYWNTSPLIWNYYQNSILGLSLRDSLVLAKAKTELKTDILERMQKYISDGSFATEEALLDAIYEKDDEQLLKNVLVYKFFELWFQQDATSRDSLAFAKATMYYRKYSHYVQINVRRLGGLLAVPREMPRYRMRSAYGY